MTRITYPPAPRRELVEVRHGVSVPDPFRLLEKAEDPETVAWVEAENLLTRQVLDGPVRDRLRARLEKLFDYPRVSIPSAEGGRLFYYRNRGLQDQPVLYVRPQAGGEEAVLIDPNGWSSDGTVALTGASPSRDGRRVAYTLSRSGSDRQEILVRDVESGRDLPDRVLWAKFTSPSFLPDGSGFLYTRFPEPGTVPAGDESYFSSVWLHRLGEAQAQDTLLFEDHSRKEVVFSGDVSRDGRWLVVTGWMGASGKAEVHVADRRAGGPLRLVLQGFDDSWTFLGSHGHELFFRTDQGAPRGALVAVDAAAALEGRDVRRVVIPQGADTLTHAVLAGGRLVAHLMREASSRLQVHGLEGAMEREIPLPRLGTVGSVTGAPEDPVLYFDFTSFAQPSTPYRYDVGSGHLQAWETVDAGVDASRFVVAQEWCRSADGTRVPMFLVHLRDLPRDGERPTLLYGYGGFNVSLTPSYAASRVLWMEEGGVLAVANLRGGGEFGEEWHEAGMLGRKQNVFDDFVACAEHLVAGGLTRPARLAIQGGSNGGLLVGACLVQRPELFGAVLCQVPVADLLRYHLFTVGRFWIPEYGSADDPEQFPFLLRASPYHNVRDGVAYPATLVVTADTDDRVDPGMAKKLAARLQEATSGEAPILLRVETRAGHGMGKPIRKQLDEQADVYAFLWRALGLD
jgi:prolyl oligopeptidase